MQAVAAFQLPESLEELSISPRRLMTLASLDRACPTSEHAALTLHSVCREGTWRVPRLLSQAAMLTVSVICLAWQASRGIAAP